MDRIFRADRSRRAAVLNIARRRFSAFISRDIIPRYLSHLSISFVEADRTFPDARLEVRYPKSRPLMPIEGDSAIFFERNSLA
jgi:hypothetical protein